MPCDPNWSEQVAKDVLDAITGHSVVWITHGTIGLDRMDHILALETLASRAYNRLQAGVSEISVRKQWRARTRAG